MKRILSLLLVVCMVLSMIPAYAKAAENEPQVQLDNGEVTMESTNPLGEMLMNEIEESREDSEEDTGFVISGLVIEGNTATVSISTLEAANLMVALYTEDGVQMLCSGKVMVQAGQKEATVTIEGTVPQYFYARAFLLDTYDYSPLSKSYSTPMYTREMQELLNSTAEDYDQDRVLTLAEDTSSNFMVYQKGTVVIRPNGTENIMTQANDDTRTYVIENATGTVTSMKEGTIFVYEESAENVVIVKISTIAVNGKVVTVEGQDVELEEVFSHVKLEQTGDAGQMQPEADSQPDEGVTFKGIEEEGGVPTRSIGGSNSVSKSASFEIKEKKIGNDNVSVTLEGTLKIQLDAGFDFYVSLSHQFVQLRIDTQLGFEDFSITGKITLEKSLGSYGILLAGIKLAINPKVTVSFSAKMTFDATLTSRLGFAYTKGEGFQNLYQPPKLKTEKVSFSGTIYIGFDLCPTVSIVNEKIAKLSIGLPVGFELKGKLYENPNYDTKEDYGGEVHNCQDCIEMELFFKMNLNVTLQFFNCKYLKVEGSSKLALKKLQDMYYCVDNQTFGMGICPNIEYRVTVAAEDYYHNPVAGSAVVYDILPDTLNKDFGTTNQNGTVYQYLTAGQYAFRANIEGASYGYTHEIDQAGKIVLGPNVKEGRNFIAERLDPYDYLQDGRIISSGSCGDEVEYILYASGHLVITGTGPMKNYTSASSVPWYYKSTRITRVIVSDGVTSIGDYAFAEWNAIIYGGYPNLEEVYISEDVEYIGKYAFDSCGALKTINFPEALTTIGHAAFEYCESLEEVTIPAKVTTIGRYAFMGTTSLKKVNYEAVNANPDVDITQIFVRAGGESGGFDVVIDKNVQRIPGMLFQKNGVGLSGDYECHVKSVVFEPGSRCTEIGESAFEFCTALPEIILPEGLQIIDDYAFLGCTARISGIPSTVTVIGVSAFRGATGLEDGTLPACLVSIGTGAFSGCTALKAVSFNSPVTEIPYQAFHNCTALEEIRLFDGLVTIGTGAFSGCTALKEISFPNTVTTVEQEAFLNCASMETVAFNDTLTTIGKAAFKGCASLTEAVIPDSVTSLGKEAFQSNTAMESFHLGKGVTSFTADVLYYNHNLSTLTVTTGNTKYVGQGNCIISKSGYPSKVLIAGCKGSVIPTSSTTVTSIGEYAFRYNEGLTSITIPSNISSIKDLAFADCPNLKTVTFTGSKMSFSSGAFARCTALESIAIPASATTTNTGLFVDCTALKEVNLGSSLKTIDNTAFQGCTALESIEIPGTVTKIGRSAFEGCSSLKSIVIPNSVTTLDTDAFSGCTALESVTIGSGLTTLNNGVFDGCSSLRSVTIPDTVTTIGNYVFRDCTALETVAIGSSVTSIGYSAFKNCTSLRSVVIPKSVATMGTGAFENCTALESVTIDSVAATVGNTAFLGCTSLRTVDILGGEIKINNEAFKNCAALERVTIGSEVTYVGVCAFANCTSLKSIVIPDGDITLKSYVFSDCTALESVAVGKGTVTISDYAFEDCASLRSFVVLDGEITMGKYAFRDCVALESVSIGNGVTTIDENAFAGCTSLKSIVIPESVTKIEDNAFDGCTSLKSIVIPNSVTTMDYNAFKNCTALESVTIGSGLTTLNNYVFDGCSSLRSVVIPDSVTTIGKYVFRDCKALETVTIGSGVTTINSYAFDNDSNLKAVVFRGNAPSTFNSYAFSGVKATVYYPEGNDTWSSKINKNYGGTLTWVAYTPGTDPIPEPAAQPEQVSVETKQVETVIDEPVEKSRPATRAIYPGDQESTADKNEITTHTATFDNLVPGQEYVFLAVASMEAEDLLAADNLLYIYQAPADENGVLTVTYIQRVEQAPTYIMACGASQKELTQENIHFQPMYADNTLQVVKPVVTYGGQTLTEGNDYIVSGTVDFTQPGTYTCYIRGIYDYSGTVECQYTVGSIENANVTFADKVYHNLRLQDLTKIGYAFQVETPVSATYGVLIWTDETIESATVENQGVQNKVLTYDSGFYTAESDGIYAQRLDTTHYARPYAKVGSTYFYGEVDVYSPLTYARTVLSGNDESLKQLMVDLLNYGAYAQLYFAESQKTEAPETLINDMLTQEQKGLAWSDSLKVLTPVVTKQTANTLDAKWFGTNLNLLTAIQMNMAATGEVTGMYYWSEEAYHSAAVLDGETATARTSLRTDGKYTIGGIAGIVAQGIRDTYYVCCYDAEGNLGPIRADSVAAYATRLMDSASATEATANMAKALLIYGNSAETYFAENS